MGSTVIRNPLRTLHYRHLLVRQMVQMKSRDKQRLHKVKYFRDLLATNPEVDDRIRPLLKLSREFIQRCERSIRPWSVHWNKIHCGGNGWKAQDASRSWTDDGTHVATGIGDVSRFQSAPKQSRELASVYERAQEIGNARRATIASLAKW
jgi:hypothetical protein